MALLFGDYLIHSPEQREQFRVSGWEILDVQDCESSRFVGQLRQVLEGVKVDASIVIDITGLPTAALAFLVRIIRLEMKFRNVTWIYAEPQQYLKGESTEFAVGLQSVSPLRGFAARSEIDDEGALVVLAGYDSAALRAVAEYRKSAHPRFLIIPFPPLQAQMYQEVVLRIQEVRDSLLVDAGDRTHGVRVPAFDAWGTVEALGVLLGKVQGRAFSVAPLSTKPQTLGVFLWWSSLQGDQREQVSIIVPRYSRLQTRVSEGLGRIWRYRLSPSGSEVSDGELSPDSEERGFSPPARDPAGLGTTVPAEVSPENTAEIQEGKSPTWRREAVTSEPDGEAEAGPEGENAPLRTGDEVGKDAETPPAGSRSARCDTSQR